VIAMMIGGSGCYDENLPTFKELWAGCSKKRKIIWICYAIYTIVVFWLTLFGLITLFLYPNDMAMCLLVGSIGVIIWIPITGKMLF